MKRLVASLLVIAGVALVHAFSFPQPTGYVTDGAGIIPAETKADLERELSAFAASTTNEIAVVTVKSLEGATIEEYAVKLFESFGIGTKKNDNGILLLVAPNERQVRIEVGYGLEGAVPDIVANDIITNKITPWFKNADYAGGIAAGVSALIEATKGEYQATAQGNTAGFGKALEGMLVFFFFGLSFLASILGRSKSWWAGGVIGGVLGALSTYFGLFGLGLIWGTILTVLLILLGLLFDFIVSSGAIGGGGIGGPWIPGMGGGGRGGSSFGGFGGGRSGGGGSSGSW